MTRIFADFINKVPRVDNAQSYPINIHKGNWRNSGIYFISYKYEYDICIIPRETHCWGLKTVTALLETIYAPYLKCEPIRSYLWLIIRQKTKQKWFSLIHVFNLHHAIRQLVKTHFQSSNWKMSRREWFQFSPDIVSHIKDNLSYLFNRWRDGQDRWIVPL